MSEKQNYECKAILMETATGKMSMVANDYEDIFEATSQEANDTFLVNYATDIKAAKKKGTVKVICRPFCG